MTVLELEMEFVFITMGSLLKTSFSNNFGFFFSCSMMGSDPATTNYPGKFPSGLDLPSDVTDEKLSDEGKAN